jgi:hypothetical protein
VHATLPRRKCQAGDATRDAIHSTDKLGRSNATPPLSLYAKYRRQNDGRHDISYLTFGSYLDAKPRADWTNENARNTPGTFRTGSVLVDGEAKPRDGKPCPCSCFHSIRWFVGPPTHSSFHPNQHRRAVSPKRLHRPMKRSIWMASRPRRVARLPKV